MHSIANTLSTLDGNRDDATMYGMLQVSCISRRGLDYIPDLKDYMLQCDRARVEVRVEVNRSSTVSNGQAEAFCRVYTIQVFALRDGQPSSRSLDSVARYQLNVDPTSDLGLRLGEVIAPYVGLTSDDSFAERGDVELLMREIDDVILNHRTAKWRVVPADETGWITEDDIERVAPRFRALGLKEGSMPNATPSLSKGDPALPNVAPSLLRVIPSFHEFVTDRLSTCTKFVSTKSTQLRCFTLVATVRPQDEVVQLKLLTQDTSGKVLDREDFMARLQEPDPDAWLHSVKERVYNLAPGSSVEEKDVDEQKAARKLLNHVIDTAVVFRNDGPSGIRRMFGRTLDKRPSEKPQVAGGYAVSERDNEILRGEINPELNQLSDRFEAQQVFGDTFDHGPARWTPLVHLEIGDQVARVSVHASGREGSATVAWYLKNNTPFSSGDTSALERMWKAAELLQRNSEGSIHTGLEELCVVSTPKYQGLTNLHDVLDFDIEGIKGIEFSSVKPVLLAQMARVVEGIEDIDATVRESYLASRYPENFQKMRFSLHNDGSLSIQAVNSFKGRLTAFIPAAGFDATMRSRSDTIKLLSKLMVWRPENARRDVQRALKSLADITEGWYSSTGNDVDAPGLANDIPPIDSVHGTLAYEHAVRIAKSFADISKVEIGSIPISLMRKGSIRPLACSLILIEPATHTKLGLVVDDVGIKTAILRYRSTDGAPRTKSIAFIRPSRDNSPFSTREQLRQLLTEYSRLGDDVRRYRREVRTYEKQQREHPQRRLRTERGKQPFTVRQPTVDLSKLITRLSEEMRRLRES